MSNKNTSGIKVLVTYDDLRKPELGFITSTIEKGVDGYKEARHKINVESELVLSNFVHFNEIVKDFKWIGMKGNNGNSSVCEITTEEYNSIIRNEENLVKKDNAKKEALANEKKAKQLKEEELEIKRVASLLKEAKETNKKVLISQVLNIESRKNSEFYVYNTLYAYPNGNTGSEISEIEMD